MTHDPREALEIVQRMIEGEAIEAAIIDVGTMKSLGDVVKEALTASAPKGEQQPVAWRVRMEGEVSWALTYSNPKFTRGVAEAIPLYTSPPPAAGWDEAAERVQSAYDELCVRFSGVHSDDAMDSVLLRLHAALKALRRESPASSGVADRNLDAEVAALAHRFWSIHPSSLDDMGLTREQFYVQEITKLIKAVRG